MLERTKRTTAGNRMTKLIEEQNDEDEEDEFYKNTYGGFNEEEEDNDYKSEEEQEDIVDSGKCGQCLFLDDFHVKLVQLLLTRCVRIKL